MIEKRLTLITPDRPERSDYPKTPAGNDKFLKAWEAWYKRTEALRASTRDAEEFTASDGMRYLPGGGKMSRPVGGEW